MSGLVAGKSIIVTGEGARDPITSPAKISWSMAACV
jgi:hypothetical protein